MCFLPCQETFRYNDLGLTFYNDHQLHLTHTHTHTHTKKLEFLYFHNQIYCSTQGNIMIIKKELS